MAGVLRNISVVALATTGSRVLGLVRDILLFALLGVGPVSSAFILAFTLPNLFRRLLGEGALSSAFIPVLAEVREIEGRSAGFALLNAVLIRLAWVLVGIVAIGWILLSQIDWLPDLPERYYLGAELTRILLPYVALICLAAIIGAALNVERRFLSPALSAIWLNLAMIGALAIGAMLPAEQMDGRVLWLCGGVLVGGLFQLGVPAFDLALRGWRPSLAITSPPRLDRVFELLLPGLAGAAIFQINILVSRLLAFSLNDDASGILYLASRLVELPLGIFSIAVSTVLFPELARLRATSHGREFAHTYNYGLRLIFLVTLPAGIGLAALSEPILTVLFAWGRFGGEEVSATIWPLVISACGVPFYAWMGLCIRGFHAVQDMKTPVRFGVLNLVLNLLLSLVLMKPFGASGLALANVLASATHAIAMELALRRRLEKVPGKGRTYFALFSGAAMMGFVIVICDSALSGMLPDAKIDALLRVGLLVPGGVLVYATWLYFSRIEDLEQFRRRWINRRRPARPEAPLG